MSSKTTAFPYQSDVKGNLFPLVPVSLSHNKNRNDYFALIDSGATISAFKTDVAEYLEIDIEKGKEITLRGAGGWIKGFMHNIDTEVAGKKFTLPIIFSREYLVSLNILGRSSFFEKFKITFDEANKSVILT